MRHEGYTAFVGHQGSVGVDELGYQCLVHRLSALRTCKGPLQTAEALQAFLVPWQRFTHFYLDLVGPLPTSANGFRFVLTMVDHTTRWLEVVPLGTVKATTYAEVFIASWVACLACWLVSPLTRGGSSQRQCGRDCVVCSTLSILTQLHTIHKPMVWWSGHTSS